MKPQSLESARVMDEVCAECSYCGGHGYLVRVEPGCCGNLYAWGECRAHCAVPGERQDQCGNCNGQGFIIITDGGGK